jgi:hypothetical protein
VTLKIYRLPLCPFPPIPWWSLAASGQVALDGLEHYPKRTFRNRYTLMQSTGPMEMTIPVERRGGRPRAQDETNRMGGDHDRKAWQAIKTAYGRAPFFEEMEDELRGLFEDGPGTLGAWNRASIVWASSWLDIPVPTDVSAAEYPDTESVDLPSLVASFAAGRSCNWSHVWQDRQRSIPFESLGILDLLLHLGPEAGAGVMPIPQSGFPRPGSHPE